MLTFSRIPKSKMMSHTLPSRNYYHGRQDRARRKMEAETELKIIHPYHQQISIIYEKRCTNKIFKASLLRSDFVLFKILEIENIPSRYFESVREPSQKALDVKWSLL